MTKVQSARIGRTKLTGSVCGGRSAQRDLGRERRSRGGSESAPSYRLIWRPTTGIRKMLGPEFVFSFTTAIAPTTVCTKPSTSGGADLDLYQYVGHVRPE
jgi:hypothetical protein